MPLFPSMPPWLQANIDSGQTGAAEGPKGNHVVTGEDVPDKLANLPAKVQRKKRPKKCLPAAWKIEFNLPCQVVSEANKRDHWTKRNERFGFQGVCVLIHGHFIRWDLLQSETPIRVTLTHVGATMDDDNLRGAFKGIRDYIAKRIGIDDGDPRIEWAYQQELSTKVFGVRVVIEKLGPVASTQKGG